MPWPSRKSPRLKNRLAEEKLYLEDEIRTEYNFEEIVGESPKLRALLRQVETVAPTDSTVLIGGETGTGKELIARAIHNLSARRDRTFIKINCAAIPTGLLESELFGHERGAFTGAIAQKLGRFELADQGTIFLDEVGDIPLELQPKLLRVLQEQEFERLGSPATRRVNVRMVAATNRDLARLVETGGFREDLYYRLNVFPVAVPPLRERREDIPVLVRYFAQKYAQRMNRTIETVPVETLATLQRYRWPGNVRELENLIERAVILSPGKVLRVPLTELKPVRDARPAALDHSRRGRARAYSPRARRPEMALGRPAGRRRKTWHETHHLAVPHAKTRHHSAPCDLDSGDPRHPLGIPETILGALYRPPIPSRSRQTLPVSRADISAIARISACHRSAKSLLISPVPLFRNH